MYSNTAAFKNKPVAAAAPAAQGLLDQVGVDAIAALGFYKLNSAYTGDCIEVRRSSDSATQDIGFTGAGVLDTAALATFCGTDTGYIKTWYDQSGNGFDFNVTNFPSQGGNDANQPIIYYSSAVTTDAAGNIAAYSTTPGSTAATGTLFLNSPTMTARQRPNITIFGQINTQNGNGIFHTELGNGCNMGTYGQSGNKLSVIRSNGTNLLVKQTVNTDATDPFASTVWYNDDGTGKWWLTSELNNATFENTGTVAGFNVANYSNATIFRYYSNSLYQNCALSGYVYWDIADNSTLSTQEVYDLYDWVETNLGYTNNAPTP